MQGTAGVVRDVYWCAWTYRRIYLRSLLPPFAAYLLSDMVAMAGDGAVAISFAIGLVGDLLFCRVLASWHRFVIGGTLPAGSWFTLSRDDLLFFVAFLAFEALDLGIGLLAGAVAPESFAD